ncbi:hypothetical protein KCMC57_up53050 [Kitasatospora sp. CMC57]|uniref:ANTAR domain-containing protein n=1 Tax=Kitasatospora sp. CMC57 TaxID=3231513 RepID=A0AB33K633_9ACTN
MPGDVELAQLQATIDRLRSEVEGQRRAMRTRAVIEQAKGVLAERLGCSPEDAFGRLVQLSQGGNRKLVDIAAELLGVAVPPDAADHIPVVMAPGSVSAPSEHSEQPPTGPASAQAPRPEELGPGFAARYHLAAAALGSADTPDEVAALPPR